MSAVPFAMLRHAPTEWNAAGRLQGLTDTCLSRDGEAAARRWRLPLPAAEFARLYARGKTWHLPPTASAAHARGS